MWNWSDGISLGTYSTETANLGLAAGPSVAYSTILADTKYFITKPQIVKANTAITAGQILVYEGNVVTGALIPAANTVTIGTTLIAGIAMEAVPVGSTDAVTTVTLVAGQVKASKIVFASGTTDTEKAEFVVALQSIGITVVNDF